MFVRIEFTSKKFKVPKPVREGHRHKPKYTDLYKWLTCEMDKKGIKHKLIDLDAMSNSTERSLRLGNTVVVEDFNTKYQLVWGWLPDLDDPSNNRGVWSLEIYKMRSFLDKALFKNRLNKHDPLVMAIFSFLEGQQYSSVKLLAEREIKARRDKYRAMNQADEKK